MNAVASPAWTPAPAGPSGALTIMVLVLGSATMAAVAAMGNGGLTLAAALIVVMAGFGASWLASIRYPLFVVIFLSLAVDVAGEGPWDSPLAPLGALLAYNVNKTVPLPAVSLPGVALLLVFLLCILVQRNLSGSRLDRTPTAEPLNWALGGSCVAVLALCAWGYFQGGDLQMAKNQVQNFVLTLLLAYLCALGLRGLPDYRTLGRLVVLAGCIKAVNAIHVMSTVVPRPEYATSHGDSVLFATAFVLVLIRFAEKPAWRTATWCFLLLPLLGWGMVANERRLVWVQIAGALLMFWLVSRRSRAKRFVARALIAVSPLLIAYLVVGWNSQSSVFAPVQAFRSTGVFGADEQVDASTLYRDTENYNLLITMRSGPLLGTGFGRPFLEVVTLPSISFFKEYRYFPHNSLLGLWAFAGAVGFTGISIAFVAAVYFAGRSYRLAKTPEQRTAAIMVLAVIVIHAVQCWGDIGFSERKSIFLVGPALGIAGQLAVATGAWRGRLRKGTA